MNLPCYFDNPLYSTRVSQDKNKEYKRLNQKLGS